MLKWVNRKELNKYTLHLLFSNKNLHKYFYNPFQRQVMRIYIKFVMVLLCRINELHNISMYKLNFQFLVQWENKFVITHQKNQMIRFYFLFAFFFFLL